MAEPLKVTDPDNVSVTFINQVLGQGHTNGVINLTLGVARFTPETTGEIDVDMVIASRLRMDIVAAQQLRDCLDELLRKILPKVGDTIQ